MYDITAEQLFGYLLKDRMARKRQMLDDIEQGNLSPDAINSELLAANKVITDNDSLDSDLDYIDSVLGDPQVEPAEDWVENAVAQQIDNTKIAKDVYNNIRKAGDFKELQDVKRDANVTRDTQSANANRDAVRLDRMLYNINKDNFLADSEKVDMALRLLFDYNTRRYGMYPEDIRLSQDDIWKQLMLNETPGERLEDYQQNAFVHDAKKKKLKDISDPTFMEKERVIADTVPISYESDKDNSVGQLFTPSLEANTVYEIFANALINDIKNNKAPALDNINKYINDTYRNKLKTMTYSDWEKEIAKENTPVDVNKIVEQAYLPREAKISTGSALGDDIAWRVRQKRLDLENESGYSHDRHLSKDAVRGMVEAYLVTADDDLDVPDDALTPEDWADKLPDNPRLRNKSKEEKEDNKLNRWHADDKEEYKKFLDEMYTNADPDNTFAVMLNASTADDLTEKVKQYLNEQAPVLIQQFKNARADGNTAIARELAKRMQYYRAMLNGENVEIADDLGHKFYINGEVELSNWVHRIMTDSHRNNYDLKEKKTYNTKSTVNSLFKDAESLWKEEDEEGNVKPRKPQTEFERDAYKWLDNMQKVWNKYKADKLDDEIEAKEVELKNANNKSKDKPKEDWEKDLVDMEEEHGRR